MKNSIKDVTDIERFNAFTEASGSGWWQLNIEKKRYKFCKAFCDLFGWKDNLISVDDFFNYVRADCRESEKHRQWELTFEIDSHHECICPMISKRGEVWIKFKMSGHKKYSEGEFAFGTYKILPAEQASKELELEAVEENNAGGYNKKVLSGFNSALAIVSDLITGKSNGNEIETLLRLAIDIFALDNASLFKFLDDKKTVTCMKSIASTSEGANFFGKTSGEIVVTRTKWLYSRLLSNNSIILNSLSELPPEAAVEYDLFSSVSIKSTIVIPIVIDNVVTNYLGVDMIGKERKWSSEDYIGLLFLSRIFAVYLSITQLRYESNSGKDIKSIFLNYMPFGYAKLHLSRDAKGKIVDFDVNEANARINTFYANAEFVSGAEGSKMFFGDELIAKLNFLALTADKLSDEYIVRNPDGTYYRKIAYSLGKDDIALVTMDVSEAESTKKSLSMSEKLFKDLFTSIPIGEALYDEHEKMTDMNDAFMEIFGLTSLEDVKDFHLLDEHNMDENDKKKLREGDALSFRIEDYDFSKVDNYVTRRHGKTNLNCKMSKLYDDEKNFMGYFFICMEDDNSIVEGSRRHDFDDFFSQIGDYAKIGYAKYNLVDGSGFATKQWFRNMNLHEESAIKDFFASSSLSIDGDVEKIRQVEEDIKSGKIKEISGELRVKEDDGSIKWLYSTSLVVKFRPEKNIVECISVNYDITSFKEVQQELSEARINAENMDKMKSAFLANMSHEIRTPLNAIVGFSDLLSSAESVQEREEYLSILHENNDMLLKLINDILDLSKLEAGAIEFKYADTDINVLISDIVKVTQLKTKDDVKVLFDMASPVCHLNTDRYRLSQVISNFAGNAVKFTEHGNINIGYEWIDNDHIKFHVRDTGPGIDNEKQLKIFDRFVKLNDFEQGTGLGLSISESIVKKMGGQIGVNSTLGDGSCFWFILPADRKEATSADQETEKASAGDGKSRAALKLKSKEEAEAEFNTPRQPFILVAEDIDSNYILDKALLKGCRLERAKDGEEAVSMARALNPDIILMDIQMPKMTGIEAAKKIREFNKSVPIIAVTAFAYKQDKEDALESGCNDFVTKPINARQLKAKIKHFLSEINTHMFLF